VELTPKRADLTPVDTQFDTSTSTLLGGFDRFDTYREGDRFVLEERARQHDADRRARARGMVPIPYRWCQKCQIHQTASMWGCQIGVKSTPVGVKFTRKSGVKPPPEAFRSRRYGRTPSSRSETNTTTLVPFRDYGDSRNTDSQLTADKTKPTKHT